MKRGNYTLLVWVLFAIITLVSIYGAIQDVSSLPANAGLLNVLESIVWALGPIVFALLATLIVSQRPGNVIGWLMMMPSSVYVVGFFTSNYLEQFSAPPAEPTFLFYMVALLNDILWLALIFPLLFTMLLFPDGRPPSPRWRWILVAGLGMCAFLILFGLALPSFTLAQNSDWGVITNPIGFLPAGIEFPDTAWFAGLIIMTLLCVAAPFVRFRRAAGVEREQIKWLFYASGLFVLTYIPNGFISDENGDFLVRWVGLMFVLGIMAFPVAIAIAILRYRLYDIDVIIRKTLLYGALTGLLLLVYFGGVVIFQALFESITGQRSPVAIVISTLLIAALFTPLRRRLQQAIDRRFFRQKYDAQLVLTQFAQTARDEVDLESLTDELARVTRETVQPESITIWLKSEHS